MLTYGQCQCANVKKCDERVRVESSSERNYWFSLHVFTL